MTFAREYGKDDTNRYVLAAETKSESLECRAVEGAARLKWFHDTWHGQLVTDLYSIS